MIIWGSKVREVVVSGGGFNCPECNSEKTFSLIKAKKYFTLYFIPLFETETVGTYVKCNSCLKLFNDAVLKYRPPTPLERLTEFVRHDLSSGTPAQMVIRKLINGGLPEESSQKLVASVIGNNRKACMTCRLDYLGSIKTCSSCGGAL